MKKLPVDLDNLLPSHVLDSLRGEPLSQAVPNAYTLLTAHHLEPSVRRIHRLTHGSFRDVCRFLRAVKAEREDADASNPAPHLPVVDFVLECLTLNAERSTTTTHLKRALSRWRQVTDTLVTWGHLKQALRRLGCRATHGGHTWQGVGLSDIGPHLPPESGSVAASLPACERCQQTTWEPRYGEQTLWCGTCRATMLTLRARLLAVRPRSATRRELTLQHARGLIMAWGNPQEVQRLDTLHWNHVVLACGMLQRPPDSDVVFHILSICHVCRV